MALADQLRHEGTDDWFITAVEGQARGFGDGLSSYLDTIEAEGCIEGTVTRCRTHFIKRNLSGEIRVEALAEKLAAQVVDYCIPRSRISEAVADHAATGSLERILGLHREATELFAAVENSGEAGELLLFVLLERLLGMPQVLCKMSLKTNANVHYHGVDGVHLKAQADGRVAVYWCESKIYGDFRKAIESCFSSIAPFLLEGSFGAARRDILLLKSNLDSGNAELDEILVKYFIEDDLASTLREFRGASLIGFSLADYPDLRGGSPPDPTLLAKIDHWHEAIGEKAAEKGLAHVEMEAFCVPLPSAHSFREAFRNQLVRT